MRYAMGEDAAPRARAVRLDDTSSQTPCRGNITRSTMFTVFENAMGAVTPHLTLARIFALTSHAHAEYRVWF